MVGLKALNKFKAEEHFKMEGFHMVKDLAEPKDWMAKIDLKDAYFLVPVIKDTRSSSNSSINSTVYHLVCPVPLDT